MRGCLNMAVALLEETNTLLDGGIHWPTVEEFYCPGEEGFVDSPGHWEALGQARGAGALVAPEPDAPEEVQPMTVTQPVADSGPRRRTGVSSLLGPRTSHRARK